MSRDDELAQTAAADTPAVGSGGAPPVGQTLGRYRVQRVLGAGGMGVVHEAFDPELERRVALKVLKSSADVTDEARQRLLREARAMARVKHPNVVTVYEVDTDGGRDFVAMELVDGESLADWLRTPHTRAEILTAFIAAGRGLAAAHAAGLVHRDFKPHNVLRSRDGRVLVTDFGLARGVEGAPAKRTSAPVLSPLVELTGTGAIAGTPAYMAPEQWRGEEVGPAADQFAFCVALWEALAGERPFRGDTPDQLREAIERGTDGLFASKLPRALRAPILRGLAADRSKRWPKIDDLLARLDRRGARTRLAFAGSFAVVAAAIVFAIVSRGDGGANTACMPSLAELLRGSHGRDLLVRDALASYELNARTCAAPAAPHRTATLTCLAGVGARADAIGTAAARFGDHLDRDSLASSSVDPAACDQDNPPQLNVTAKADIVDAFAVLLDPNAGVAEVRAFARRPGLDPCAQTLVLEALVDMIDESTESRAVATESLDAAERCGDERARTDALLAVARTLLEAVPTAQATAAVERARAAVNHVRDGRELGVLELVCAQLASSRGELGEAISDVQEALRQFGKRGALRSGLQAAFWLQQLRLERSLPEDLAAISRDVEAWRPAAAERQVLAPFELAEAQARFYAGDDRGVRDIAVREWRPDGTAAWTIHGIVRDPAGKPVSGALVVGGHEIVADSTSIWFPLDDTKGEQRMTRSDTAGAFALDLVGRDDLVVAQLGALRSPPLPAAEHLELVLVPTRALDGRIDLAGIPSTRVRVMVAPPGAAFDQTKHATYEVAAPLAPDGSFHLAGVATSSLVVTALVMSDGAHVTLQTVAVPAGTANAHVELALRSGDRSVTVIVRSTLSIRIDSAYLELLPGEVTIHRVEEMVAAASSSGCRTTFAQPATSASGLPPGILRPDDLAAQFDHLTDGTYTLCAVALNGDLADDAYRQKLWAHLRELQLACTTFRADAGVVTLEAPPQKRFAD
jgi:predicted Ser/Thr protein kinase